MAVDVDPEELVRLGLIEGTFPNISLGIVQQFHSVARHFGGGGGGGGGGTGRKRMIKHYTQAIHRL